MRFRNRVAALKALGTISVLIICYSWILRPALLQWGAAAAEIDGPWPGQDLFKAGADGAEPAAASVRAVTIAVPPARVWPWLAQLGQHRAGFYSHWWLESLLGCDIANASGVHTEWQSNQPGDRVLLAPAHRYGGKAFLVVARAEPARALVLVSPRDWEALQNGGRASSLLWSLELLATPGGGTRLIARLARRRTWADPPLWELAHFVLERAMLLGIRRRAETNPAVTAAVATESRVCSRAIEASD